LWECLGRWSAYLVENGKQADCEPPSWLVDAINKATTSPLPAQPAQEPFGYFKAEPFGWTDCAETDEGAKALYEAPPKREWVGLTDDELADIWYKESLDWMEFARAHEAALKEKNT
jgi:hypothetical protein